MQVSEWPQTVRCESAKHTCALAEGLDLVHMAAGVHYLPERLVPIVASPTLDVHPCGHVAWGTLLVQSHQPLCDHLQIT